MHPTASSLPGLGITFLGLLVPMLVAAGYALVGRHLGEDAATVRLRLVRAIVAVDVWLIAPAGLGVSGVLGRFDVTPPPMMLFMVAIVVGAIGVGVSRVGTRLASLPLVALVGFQMFRLPLEL